jgi:hypothetical protein
MRHRIGLRGPARFALLLLALAAGCGRKSEDLIADSSDSSAYRNPAAIPHPSPPQPAGPQVGKSDPTLNAAAPLLRDWVTMWQAALPGFQVDSTWKVDIQRWTPTRRRLQRTPESMEAETALAYRLLSSRSPDGRYVLDVDIYQAAFPMGGDTIEVGGEPDSQPVLIDFADSTEVPLQFCGPGCGFHWGTWLSPSRFALGGWQSADDYSQWFQGSLAIYSLKDLTVRRYETRIVSGTDFARYQTAWKRWLHGRWLKLPGGPQASAARAPGGVQVVALPGH